MRSARAFCLLFALVIFASAAHAQACPGGLYPDGTCIGPCQNCLNTGNCTAAFAGWQCDPNAPCSVPQYQLCYPTYNTYDVKYGGQFCGLIIDWQDGECIPGAPWLPFNRFAPPKRGPLEEPLPVWPRTAFRLSIGIRQPVAFTPRPIRNISLKDRFWWKHRA